MVRHVVVFTFNAGTTPEQVAHLEDGLAALPGQIAELRGFRFGTDLGLVDGTDDFAVVADFDDAEGYGRYAAHPAHQDVIATRLRPIMAGRHVVQFAT